MTKESFLQNPRELFKSLQRSIPIEWIAEAWRTTHLKGDITYELTRSVSKNGDFFLAGYWLEILPRLLTGEEVVELYETIRDESERLEFEWRKQFEQAFAQHAHRLPPIQQVDDTDQQA
jgi:hypothetical protein